MTFYTGLVNGLIRETGDEMTMWAFLTMCTGLMLGVVQRSFHRAYEHEESA